MNGMEFMQRLDIFKNRKTYGKQEIQEPENFKTVLLDWRAGKITAVKAMELTGLKKNTFYKMAKREG